MIQDANYLFISLKYKGNRARKNEAKQRGAEGIFREIIISNTLNINFIA